MSKRHIAIPVPAAIANGANGVDVSDLQSVHLSIVGTFTATYKVKVSYDNGATFVQFGADVTAAADVSIPDAATVVRVDCSAWTSGTPTGAVSGVVAQP